MPKATEWTDSQVRSTLDQAYDEAPTNSDLEFALEVALRALDSGQLDVQRLIDEALGERR